MLSSISHLPTLCVVPVTWFRSFACFYQLLAKSIDIAKNSSARHGRVLPIIRCLNQCFSNVSVTYNTFFLRDERKLRVFENTVLRRIFGPRRDEVTGDWRRLHNEELNDLY